MGGEETGFIPRASNNMDFEVEMPEEPRLTFPTLVEQNVLYEEMQREYKAMGLGWRFGEMTSLCHTLLQDGSISHPFLVLTVMKEIFAVHQMTGDEEKMKYFFYSFPFD